MITAHDYCACHVNIRLVRNSFCVALKNRTQGVGDGG